MLAKEQGATIRPHVIPLIEENGGIYSRNRPEARRAYWIRDLKRWAALRGKVLNFDNRAALSDPAPAGLIVAAAIETGDDWFKLAVALQEAFWVRGEDIGNADVRRAIATAAGFDAAALDKHGQSDAVAALQRPASKPPGQLACSACRPIAIRMNSTGGRTAFHSSSVISGAKSSPPDITARWRRQSGVPPGARFAFNVCKSAVAFRCQAPTESSYA